MKLLIEQNDLHYSLLLENDNTGKEIGPMALKEGFRRQNERHITILGGKTKISLTSILDNFSDADRTAILNKIKELLKSLKWEFEPKEIYRIQKQGYFDNPDILENRQSYINMVNMPDMEVFYKNLNTLLKSNLPTQVPHITLFTKGERENPLWYGISVPSMEEFNNSKPERIS